MKLPLHFRDGFSVGLSEVVVCSVTHFPHAFESARGLVAGADPV
jgi:hypothetical protein